MDPRFSGLREAGNIDQQRTIKTVQPQTPGKTNDSFLPNALKTCLRFSRVPFVNAFQVAL